MEASKVIKKADAVIKAMEYIKENYEVLSDENCPLETIDATERLLECLWDEFTDEEMNALVNMVAHLGW